MYYDFPAQILQPHFIFSEKLHKGTIIFREMQLSSLIYIISRQVPKQKSAKFPNKDAPSSQTELCQTAEQNFAKLRKSFKNICTYQLFLLPLHSFSK